MIIVVKFLMLTAMSLGTAALYRVPNQLIPWGGFCGGVGGSMLLLLQASSLNPVVATFVAACSIGALSEFLARWKKQPVSIFLIPGFIPLVPGRYVAVVIAPGAFGLGLEQTSERSTFVQTRVHNLNNCATPRRSRLNFDERHYTTPPSTKLIS